MRASDFYEIERNVKNDSRRMNQSKIIIIIIIIIIIKELVAKRAGSKSCQYKLSHIILYVCFF
jgi:hypothetical protein